MLPYFYILILSLFIAWIYHKTRSLTIFFVLCIILAVFVGLRSNAVGTDTGGYSRTFLSMGYYSNLLDAMFSISTENGWNVLNWILYQLCPHYWFFFLVVGFLTTMGSMSLIKTLSPIPYISVFFYITLGFYLFGFAGMRQALAVSVYALSYRYLIERDLVKYVIVVLIAACFHQTVLIALPLYLVFTLEFSNRKIILIAIASAILGLFIDDIMSFFTTLEDRYEVYNEIQGGGNLFALFYIIMMLFFWTQRGEIKEEHKRKYDTMFLMLVVGSMIYLMVTISGLYGEVTRLALYFQLAIILLWAYLYAYRKRKLNPIFSLCVIAIHVMYFYIYLKKIGGIVPYTMNLMFN